jgi:hypothetical protein
VVASEAYLAQANSSSEWTRRILPHFRNTNRTAARVLRRVGRGFGATALTLRLAAPGREDEVLAWLGDELLPALVRRPGIVAGQLWRADAQATTIPVQDRSLRHGSDAVADIALLVEGTSVPPLAALAEAELSVAALAARGAVDPAVAVHALVNGAESTEAPPL